MKSFEIFKAGRHTAMNGQTLEFGEGDVAASAGAYDPSIHEAPIVVGHPKSDDPAFGWIGGLSADGNRLVASPRQVNADFAEMVDRGTYKKVSASFYLPDAPNNPVPGVYYLRHVGFLGAQPPAVKGLKPVEFADEEDGTVTVEFGESELAWSLTRVARVFRRIKEFIVAEYGQDKADQVIETWELDAMTEEAARAKAEAEPANGPSFSEPEPQPKETTVKDKPINPAADDLVRREQEIANREAAFAEREAEARSRDNETLLDRAIAEARLLPADKSGLLQFMDALDASETVEFGEGEGKKTETRLDFFRRFIAERPTVVELSEIAKADHDSPATVEFTAPPGFTVDAASLEIHNKAIAHQQAHPGVEYLDAVKAVGGQ